MCHKIELKFQNMKSFFPDFGTVLPVGNHRPNVIEKPAAGMDISMISIPGIDAKGIISDTGA